MHIYIEQQKICCAVVKKTNEENQTTMSSLSAEELVGDYLYNKVHGNPLPNTVRVYECDLYGEEEPWEMWEKLGGSELERNGGDNNGFLYLFTKLKKQSVEGKRFLRRVGSTGGVWEGEDGPKKIETQFCVGFRKRFRYENPGSDQHGRWIMLEYSLDDYNGNPNHYVICSMKKNTNTTRGRKRRVAQQIESSKQEPKQRGIERWQNQAPLTFTAIPSTHSVQVQRFCAGNATTKECHHNNWATGLSDELLQNQPVFTDSTIANSQMSIELPEVAQESKMLPSQMPLPSTGFPSQHSVQVQQLCSSNAATEKCHYNDWAVWLRDELWQIQPIFADSTITNTETHNGLPELAQELMMLPNQQFSSTNPSTLTDQMEQLCSSAAAANECDDPVDYHNHWTTEFAEKLLQGHSFSKTQDSEIEMLVNEDCNILMGWERLH